MILLAKLIHYKFIPDKSLFQSFFILGKLAYLWEQKVILFFEISILVLNNLK